MTEPPYLPGFEPPSPADYARIIAALPMRDHGPYLAALRQFRDAIARAEEIVGGPAMIETKTKKLAGRVSLVVTFRRAKT